jgi:hypothetical protein
MQRELRPSLAVALNVSRALGPSTPAHSLKCEEQRLTTIAALRPGRHWPSA